MTYEFGRTFFDSTDPICIQMLGKMVCASNVGRMIEKTPSHCEIGTLVEINNSSTDRPFVVEVKNKSTQSFTFIREILKKEIK